MSGDPVDLLGDLTEASRSGGLHSHAPPHVNVDKGDSQRSTPSQTPIGLRGDSSTMSTPTPRGDLADVMHLRHINSTTVAKFTSIAETIAPPDSTATMIHGSFLPEVAEIEAALNSEDVTKSDVIKHAARLYEILHQYTQLTSLPMPTQIAAKAAGTPGPPGSSGISSPPSTSIPHMPPSPKDGFTPKALDTHSYRRRLVGATSSGPVRYTPDLAEQQLLSYCSSLASMARHSIAEHRNCEHGVDDDGFDTINNYTIVQQIGKGMYGRVYLAINSSDETYAIKTMDCGLKASKHRFGGIASTSKSPGGGKRFSVLPDTIVLREIAIMKKLHHKNIVQLKEVIHDDEEDLVHLVMQYIDRGPIAVVANDGTCSVLSPDVLKRYMFQACQGLAYLHRKKVIHRDLKPENILVSSDDTCFLADFGVSAVVRDGNVVDIAAGTQTFFSPEICSGDYEAVTKYGENSDIWALGVTMYALRFGKVPFYANNFPQLMEKIAKSPLTFPSDTDMKDLICPLLQGMLQKDPEKRWTLKQVINSSYFEETRPAKSKGPRDSLEHTLVSGKTSIIPRPPEKQHTQVMRNGGSSDPDHTEGTAVSFLEDDIASSIASEDDTSISEAEVLGAINTRRSTVMFQTHGGVGRKSVAFNPSSAGPMLLSRPTTEDDLSCHMAQLPFMTEEWSPLMAGSKPTTTGGGERGSMEGDLASNTSNISDGFGGDPRNPAAQGSPMRLAKQRHTAAKS